MRGGLMARNDNKYLTFDLGNECYSIPIMKVREIISVIEITRIPKMPSFLKGVVNLRGKIIPVIDLRLKFGLPEKEFDDLTAIIIVEMQTANAIIQTGIIVDNVEDVLDIVPSNIELPPQYDIGMDLSFLIGIGKVNEKVIMIINANKILSMDELTKLESIDEKHA
jgi:purine-binding chemotaxis protein CheW